MNYLQVEFSSLQKNEKDILIALLIEASFESFEEDENSLKAFIKEKEFNEASLANIVKKVPVNYVTTVIPQQNWNAQWESSFDPIIINNFAGIRAGFHQPLKNVRYQIIITPKMSFGTGHHATTFMMVEQMEALDFKNKKVLDFGTGTAVLAILAEKMGAASVDAIDYDEWSIENSKENAAINKCSRINLIKADTIAVNKVYDIILANINLNVIKENLTAMNSSAANESLILLSGFLKTDEAEMTDALAQKGLHLLNIIQKADWICMLAKKMK